MKESVIKKHVYTYLSMQPEFFGWVETSTGIFDPKTSVFRKRNGTGMRVGVSDLVGLWKGRGIALEIKTEKGRLSDSQIIFLSDFRKHGGIATVIRSLEDTDLLIKSLRAAAACISLGLPIPLPSNLTPFM